MADNDSEVRNRGEEDQITGPEHTVRPRWVWAGLALMILGAILAGVGVATGVAPFWIAGLVVFLLGAAGAYRGKLIYDVASAASLDEAVHEIKTGESHPGRDPMDRASDPEIKADARRTALVKHDVLRVDTYARPRVTSIGAGLLIGCAVWLVIAQWTVYADSATGNSTGLRDVGVSVVLALSAFALRLPRPEPTAWVLCLVSGAALLAFGVWLDHDNTISRLSELIPGGLAVVGCLMAVRKLRHPD